MQEPSISEQDDLQELSEEELVAEVEGRARRANVLIESLRKAAPARISASLISFVVSALLLTGALYLAYWPILTTGRTGASVLRLSAAFVAIVLAVVLYLSVRRLFAEFELRRKIELIIDEFDRLLEEVGEVLGNSEPNQPGDM